MPFKVYSAQDLGYLKQGISEMLESRLSWEGRILVIEVSEDSIKKTKSIIKIGQQLNVDYVLSGSLTIFGGSASIDLMLINTEHGKTTSFFGQYNNLNEVIPKIGELAEKVVEKLIPPPPVAPEKKRVASRHFFYPNCNKTVAPL